MSGTRLTPGDLARLAALPTGSFTGTALGRSWVVTREVLGDGRSEKLRAEERGGRGHVSANIYHLATGARVYPCEMPVAVVLDFLRAVRPAA